ncbi:MAG: polysaccharide deacetylase family protein [Deltaproteobacteria bacterium]|nr:polysaccharide deacetylase family protein [Deltaproteobacteria bacterium]
MKTFQTPLINNHPLRFFLTPSHFIGFGSYIAAFLLYFYDVRFTLTPLALFILLCFIAPFCPKIGFFLPIIRKGKSKTKGVAITFDDGPDSITTPLVLDLLSEYDAKATFFVTGKKAVKHPELINKIISNGHSIGNHTYTHDPFIMLKSAHHLHKEIETTQETLKKQGIVPLIFRPPVGITNPKLYKILDMNGLYCVNYNRRACDAGNKRIKNLAQKILKRVGPGDIIMLHDTLPVKGNELYVWLNEIDNLLSGIMNKGLSILPLSDIIGKSVMKLTNSRPEIRYFA